MTSTTGLVFIHGAGLGNYIWKEMVTYIDYPFLLIDFPNRNPSDASNKQLSFDDYVRHCLTAIRDWGKENIVVVAHSVGGLVGLKIAGELGEKVTGYVGISAAIVSQGSFISCLPFPKNLIMNIILRTAGTQPPKAAIKEGLCNDLTEEQTQTVISNFTSEAKSLFLRKEKFQIPASKKLYVKTANDNEFPLALQDKMATNLGASQIVSLDSGHLPMMSRPADLAYILNDFVQKT